MDDTEKRFWDQVDKGKSHECWPWTGRRRGGARNQYGGFDNTQAHRFALQTRLGRELRAGEIACHRCDNPLCCNPKHIYAGTAQDNMQDAWARGRIIPNDQRGERNGNAKLTADDVAAIRKRIAAGMTNVAIAKQFPVTHQMVSKIRRGHFWK